MAHGKVVGEILGLKGRSLFVTFPKPKIRGKSVMSGLKSFFLFQPLIPDANITVPLQLGLVHLQRRAALYVLTPLFRLWRYQTVRTGSRMLLH